MATVGGQVDIWAGVFALVIVMTGAVGGMYALAPITRMPGTVEAGPFLSGARPREHAVSRYHVRWYPVTLLFLAFDMEMIFMYPWAVVVAQVGAVALAEMFAFLILLMVGVGYAWREGAFRWT
ncbi:NADH-quinone oxidoreductase subunit A [Microtetraspora sp. AC03309]|uniref:NADH-quinone oxidoreductase subunit A n=1 Tax=Microtetraspora sp. AC03309 TaxID=2779376 RepID=UPI001E5640B5|nr:NADH-quinone oxidoreductase subunit A [Microtetraspora sp. AC03309]MCC5577733.1 NADH-quinone oxidoreductase subunit A [Microtetraspora sp. AC03309]